MNPRNYNSIPIRIPKDLFQALRSVADETSEPLPARRTAASTAVREALTLWVCLHDTEFASRHPDLKPLVEAWHEAIRARLPKEEA